ncbi:MAG: hypothetical protein WCI05_06830 [Myxococcales bacterium]
MRLSTTYSAVLGVLGAAFAVALSCNEYPSDLRERSRLTDASSGDTIWWQSTDPNGCTTWRKPNEGDRPVSTVATNLEPLYFAFDSVRLGSRDLAGNLSDTAWKTLGLDVDGVCTASDTCKQVNTQPCTGLSPNPDGENCRDNTFGRLAGDTAKQIVPMGIPISDLGLNCGLCKGRFNLVFRVSGYNGTRSDDKVRVDIYPSPGLENQSLFPDVCQPTGTYGPLCWPRNYPWTVDESVLSLRDVAGPNLSDSKWYDDNAYVREGVLVARYPSGQLLWPPHTLSSTVYVLPLRVTDGQIMGRIELQPDGDWIIRDGLIAGRSRGADVKAGFRMLGICPSSPLYPTIEFVESGLDLLASGDVDGLKSCDAMSFAFGFVARQAIAGKAAPAPVLQDCPATDGGLPDADAAVPDTGSRDAQGAETGSEG